MNDILQLVEAHGTPLILFSENEFKKAYQAIQQYLPNVKHHYALKPLPTKEAILAIEDCNGYIDIASIGELDLVRNTSSNMLPKCIYTHPIKSESDIEYAIHHGVTTTVAENLAELKKLQKYSSNIRVLIRIAFPNNEALCNLSERYGASEEKFKRLIEYAVQHQINIIGCCFHVGSQMKKNKEHLNAIEKCKALYDWVYINYGIKFSVLDIGGGFPAMYQQDDISMQAFCGLIDKKLNELFSDMEIWSEPGRCIAANSMLSITKIIGKAIKDNRVWYYLDDGVYGTFSGIVYENMPYELFPLKPAKKEVKLSVFAGPTCDSVDVIARNILFPEMEVNDYVFAKRIGAYSWASRTAFNLLRRAEIVPHNFSLNSVEAFIAQTKIEQKQREPILIVR